MMSLLSPLNHRIHKVACRVRNETNISVFAHQFLRLAKTVPTFQELFRVEESSKCAADIENNDKKESSISDSMVLKSNNDEPYYPREKRDVSKTLSGGQCQEVDVSGGQCKGPPNIHHELHRNSRKYYPTFREVKGGQLDTDFTLLHPMIYTRTIHFEDKLLEFIRKSKPIPAHAIFRRALAEGVMFSSETCVSLIGLLSRFKLERMAFHVFSEMTRRKMILPPEACFFLFDASLEIPEPTYIYSLKWYILDNKIQLSTDSFIRICRSFGCLGDIATVFDAADSIMKKRALSSHLFHPLLRSFRKDKKAGFAKTLYVYGRMKHHYKVAPLPHVFEIILISVKECDTGNFEYMVDLIERIKADCDEKEYPHIVSSLDSSSSCSTPKRDAKDFFSSKCKDKHLLPNLIGDPPILGSVSSFADLRERHDRLFLLGGLSGFFDEMAKFKICPQVYTYRLLMDCLPQTIDAENAVALASLKHWSKSTEVFQEILRRRLSRRQYEEAMEVETYMKKHRLTPCSTVISLLALTCKSTLKAREILEHNIHERAPQILYALMHSALTHLNYELVEFVFDHLSSKSVTVSPDFINVLDRFHENSLRCLDNNQNSDKEAFEFMKKFCSNYPEIKQKCVVKKRMDLERYSYFKADL